MVSSLIGFLIALLVVCAVIYCIFQAASLFPGTPAPLRNIAIVIIFLIFFLFLLSYFGYASGLKF